MSEEEKQIEVKETENVETTEVKQPTLEEKLAE